MRACVHSAGKRHQACETSSAVILKGRFLTNRMRFTCHARARESRVYQHTHSHPLLGKCANSGLQHVHDGLARCDLPSLHSRCAEMMGACMQAKTVSE